MTLVDTSVWVEHFRGRARAAPLVALLAIDGASTHSFVVGELAIGNTGARWRSVLADLTLLPTLPVVAHEDVLGLVASRHLTGTGIGWVDAHLLAAAMQAGTRMWTFDGKLASVAKSLDVAFEP
jgi:predicted nucleic acid-binding protein